MATNHLEDLIAEWYIYRGYFVRRNVLVGKRAKGGHECELDVVAFDPRSGHLVQVEPSMDASSWSERERRYTKKFEAGRRYIPGLFEGLSVPTEIEQIAVFMWGGRSSQKTLGGGRVLLVPDLLREILTELRRTSISNAAVPEHLPNLRTLQVVCEFWPDVRRAMGAT